MNHSTCWVPAILFCFAVAAHTEAESCLETPPGLVGWWPGDGDASDVAGGNDGSFESDSYAEARVGEGFSLDGMSYVEIQDSEALRLSSDSESTLDSWVYPTGWPPGSAVPVTVQKSYYYGMLYFIDRGFLRAHVHDGMQWTYVDASFRLPLNAWTHVAQTWDGIILKIYVNGELMASGGIQGAQDARTEDSVFIGRWLVDTDRLEDWRFVGIIDEVGLYDVALEPEEIQAIFLSGAEGRCLPDCNGNGVSDSQDIKDGTSQDCNRNGVPDECDLSQGTSRDCNANGILDECDLGLDLGFAPEKDIPSPPCPANPVAVAAGDFSSDGKPDLAIASGAANCINALLQLENGEFFKEPPLDLGNAPTSLVTADLNGDGRLDLVASTKGTQDSIRIFLGSGNCTFPRASMYTVPSGAGCIAPADLDGDGDTDIAIGSEKELRIAVLLNAGDGAFSQSTIEVDEMPSRIAASDFTGDGMSDLAVLRGETGFLSVLRNAGGATFEPGSPVVAGSSTSLPHCMASGDWDGDGDQDLAVALEGTSAVALLANAGDGTFAPAKNLSLAAAPSLLVSRDLDSDGRPDLATVSSAASKATVLRNTGALTFKEMGPFTLGEGASFLALADLVGSAAPDVLVANSGSDSLSVVRNTSTPAIEEDCNSNGALDSCEIASGAAKDCNANGIPDSCEIASGALADANKDGIPDSCQGGGTRYLRADANSDGKGDISDAIFTLVHLFRGGPVPECLDAADVTDDGKVDITDPIFFLAYLFAGGLRPADPFGACGADPTEDALGCEDSPACP